MSEPTIPVTVLRRIASDLETSADTLAEAGYHEDDPRMRGHWLGKADGYRSAAERLRDHAKAADAEAATDAGGGA